MGGTSKGMRPNKSPIFPWIDNYVMAMKIRGSPMVTEQEIAKMEESLHASCLLCDVGVTDVER